MRKGESVSLHPEKIVESAFVLKLFIRIQQAWLYGYDAAWRSWQVTDAGVRTSVSRNLDRAIDALGNKPDLRSAKRDTLEVQVWNIAGKRGRDPLAFLSGLDASEPLRNNSNATGKNAETQQRWEHVFIGLTAPGWNAMEATWALLTDEVRALVARCVPAHDPLPVTMLHPVDFAWLDRNLWCCTVEDEARIKAHRGLTDEFVQRFALDLANQHDRWRTSEPIKKSGSGFNIDYVVPESLDFLATFRGPMPMSIQDRVREVGIKYARGFFRKPPTEEERTGIRPDGSRAFYPTGIALVEAGADTKPSFLKAAHGTPIELPGDSGHLLEILSIDLTRPEVAFLGLSGTRLSICDWTDPFNDNCVTRVTLRGGVSLYDEDEIPTDLSEYEPSDQYLTPGRALLSQYEGVEELSTGGTSMRLGGMPGWKQSAAWPLSPINEEPMTFLGQFNHPASCVVYIFLDIPNLIATVVKQMD